MKQGATSWQCAKRVVSLDSPILVGILNVTPDSFSDGGAFVEIDTAVQHAMQMVDAGATVIDVGGESTRPGAVRVSAKEQIKRVLPVIEKLHARSEVLISVDTTHAEVARVAIEAGASIINDVSAGEEDCEIFSLANATQSGIVLMHRRVPPELDHYSDQYKDNPTSDDIVQEVFDWLMQRVDAAIAIGISKTAIAIDPGLGFGKSVEQNWQLIKKIDQFVGSGYPVFVGASRKSFIGATTEIEDPSLRDQASVEVALGLAEKGTQIFRVHNIAMHERVLQSLPLNYTTQ